MLTTTGEYVFGKDKENYNLITVKSGHKFRDWQKAKKWKVEETKKKALNNAKKGAEVCSECFSTDRLNESLADERTCIARNVGTITMPLGIIEC
mmetsp:Transcript_58487/g.117436  ORF Transcript_58487/g.117436 Transcript_58487/m.117436 type:complete len:94 (-) Transcript_58487:433-714(-)